MALLLRSFICWISVTLSQPQRVEVQDGEEVTLMCSRRSQFESLVFWFRLLDRGEASCVSLMTLNQKAETCSGLPEETYEMRANTSAVSLKIKAVDSSHSGPYYCGFFSGGQLRFSVQHLIVKGVGWREEVQNDCDNDSAHFWYVVILVLGGLTIFLMMMVIIALVVKIRKLQTSDPTEEQNPEQHQIVDWDHLNYAAVAFGSAEKRRKPQSNIVYAGTS